MGICHCRSQPDSRCVPTPSPILSSHYNCCGPNEDDILIKYIAMGGVLVVLVIIHNKSQVEKNARLEAYRKEQLEYRQSILSFHTSLEASASDLSLNDTKSSTLRRAVHRSHSAKSDWGYTK